MDDLIYDRDGTGFYNVADLNRVEEWSEYLSGLLREHGYAAPFEPLAIPDVETETRTIDIDTPFAFTGSEQLYTVPEDGTYTIQAAGASGSGGNAYSGTASKGGNGATLTGSFELKKGDVLRLIVGGQGSCTNARSRDGTSGGGGGCTMVLRNIDAITDSRYQFTKDTPFEVLLCVAGGGGGNDSSYSTSKNGADGEAAAFKSPTNYTAASTTTGTGTTSSVMGVQQYITNNAVGGTYSRNSGRATGGYGCGGVADDSQSYGGGWRNGTASYSATSWSLDPNATGVNGGNTGNGFVTLSAHYTEVIETPIIRNRWKVTDFPTKGKIDRLRRNVDALKNGFFRVPEWRDISYSKTIDCIQTNTWEWDLQQIYAYLSEMIAALELRKAKTFFTEAGGILNA